jgi:hypothetical protein
MFGSELAAAVHFGADQTLGAGAVAFKAAVLWWGMLAVSAVAAVSGWRLFMRLEAIDGGGRAFRLPWPRAGTTPTTTMPVFAHRHPLWRLMKKELYLQQLSWVVGGLYAFGWLALWFAKNAIPDLHMPLLFALTALNGFAVSVVAGSLGSAEERQLGTLEWHALLPMSARAQWGMKVGVTVGVACVLGLALPVALASMTGSREIRDGLQPFLSAGAGFAVIVLSVMSLYISSLCASSLQALLWSVAAGSGLMTFASSWFLMLRFGADPGFNPFLPLMLLTSWGQNTDGRLFMLLTAMSALAVSMYVGGLGLLLRFAHANHRSAERSSWRVLRQLLSLGSFLAIALILWFGAHNTFRVEEKDRHRAFDRPPEGSSDPIDDRSRRVEDSPSDAFEGLNPHRGGG